MTANINVKSKRLTAFIMFAVIYISSLNIDCIYFFNNNFLNSNNSNVVYSYLVPEEYLKVTEEKARTEFRNYRLQKFQRITSSNLFDNNLNFSFYDKNINEVKKSGNLIKLFIICSFSVFIALFIHKKDGKIKFRVV